MTLVAWAYFDHVPWPVPILCAFVLGLCLTPLARWVALRTGDVDRPVGNKIHRRVTPLMGGVAVYLAFALTSVAMLPLSPPVRGVLLGGLVAVAVGIVDEFVTLPPMAHLLGQVLAALVAVVAGVGVIEHVSDPIGGLTSPGWTIPLGVGFVLTLFWLVGMMNTVNFLDGLDGLAAGVCALAALLLAIWASNPQRFALQGMPHREDLVLPLALAGAIIGFLPFNWHLAKIFLGDSGAMFLGLSIGALAIVGPAKLATALLILVIPVLDVAWAIVRRSLRGRSFASQDKQHIYHRMVELGLSHSWTVLSLYSICIVLGMLDLQFHKTQKLQAFIIVALLAGTGLVLLEVRASSRAKQDAVGKVGREQAGGETPV